MDIWGPPLPSLSNETFAFVSVIVDFIVTAKEDVLWLGRVRSMMLIMILYSGPCKVVISGHFFPVQYFFSWWLVDHMSPPNLFHSLLPIRFAVIWFLTYIIIRLWHWLVKNLSFCSSCICQICTLPHQRAQPPTFDSVISVAFTLTHFNSVHFCQMSDIQWGLFTSSHQSELQGSTL